LRVAGVDMLEGEDGPQIMEVNSSPGLEGIEGTTKIDIASVIIEFVEEHVDFPEFDVRQRMTMSEGYGVSELILSDKSELSGQTIASSRLRDRDILILNIERDDERIANPKGSRELEAGDRLLVYGRLNEIRGLLPKRRRRKPARLSRADRERALTGAEPLPEPVAVS